MTISRKSGGTWKAGQLKRRETGVWGAATLYRKVGGIWKTDAPLAVTVNGPNFSTTSTEAAPKTGPGLASASGGVAPYTYAWTKVSGGALAAATPGAASTFFIPSGAMAAEETRTAVFHCTVTDALGAVVVTANVTATLIRYSLPAVSIAPGGLAVSGTAANATTGAATATGSSGLAPYTYAWTKLSGGSIGIDSPGAAATTFTATGLASTGESRSATFLCTVTDARGNTATATIDVSISRVAVLTASASPTSLSKNLSDTVASGTTANTTASASGGAGPFTYAWTKVSGGAITIGTAGAATTNFSATGMAQGETRSAVFKCTITDSVGQTASTANVTVTFTRANPPAPSATYTPPAGSYYADGITSASKTLNCSEPATWTWTRVGSGGANIASGGRGTSITFTTFQAATTGAGRSGTFTVDAVSDSGVTAHFTIDLEAYGDGEGSGGGGATMTL